MTMQSGVTYKIRKRLKHKNKTNWIKYCSLQDITTLTELW